jgi:iron complex outermembrane recepter protein
MRHLLIAVAALVLIQPAFAQRADDNALAEAQDAFGMSVGTETIGLYLPDEVRGFSAIAAGNARIDGLYFDRQTDLSDHVVDSLAMRVGIAAQGYPLPAPTGIVDYKLRRPGEKQLISTVLGYGAFDGRFISVDAQLPILKDQLSLGVGGTIGHNNYEFGAGEGERTAAVIAQWRPLSHITIVPFWNRRRFEADGTRPEIYVAGSYLPEEYLRGQYFGQSWTGAQSTGDNFGIITEATLPDSWSLKAGVFRSIYSNDGSFAELYVDTQPDNLARYVIIADPAQRYASTSGEVRVGRAFVGESLQQSLQFTLRGRDQRRRYGGSDELEVGWVHIGEQIPIEQPEFTFGEQTRDHVRQATIGAAYYARWPKIAELSVGVQKVDYRKEVTQPPPEESTEGRDRPVLFNVGGTYHATDQLSFYASYSRGLEEGGVAPPSAVNKDSAPPAIKTEQMDGGLRYAFSDDVRLIAGVFDIRKPYYSVDQQGFYRELADQQHRGVEISLAGDLTANMSLAVGAVLMEPRVEGELVDSGGIGHKPVGQTGRGVSLNAEYRVPVIQGFSVYSDIVSYGKRVASRDNSIYIRPRNVYAIGARQRFTMGRAQVTVRAHFANVFDNFGWRTNASNMFQPNAQRHFFVNVAADF